MKKQRSIYVIAAILLPGILPAQQGLVVTGGSPHARMNTVALNDVQLTSGFWAERFAICRDVMVPRLWSTYTSRDSCFSFQNFRVAAGLDTGRFREPSFHDGDFYKTLEAVAAMYAQTRSRQLDAWMDTAIAVIAKAQRSDGYLYTRNIIEQQKTGSGKMFDDRLSFEAYNFGHLMTAACVHYRATGKNSLLKIAVRAADFLNGFYRTATAEQARNAICPSHYMGLVELYRTTRDKQYLSLAQYLVGIRGKTEGTDDNSDRAPVREMEKVVGHAVRANYLFAGMADLYAETGDDSLLLALNRLWNNVVNTKMYITGGCGALYDGVSVDGTSYKPDTVQKIHQAYGKDYQLPNLSAHNETCANIGNVLWNWRMFLLSGEGRYADIVELALYNSVLSGVSMDGTRYAYTNPLAAAAEYPYHLRWEGGRVPYISKSNCCPPNLVRTLAEISNYFYTVGENDVYCNLYGGSRLSAKLKNGSPIGLDQETEYPWNGSIRFTIRQAPSAGTILHFRIPGWCKQYTLTINGQQQNSKTANGYIGLRHAWKTGDIISLRLHMPAMLMESNPLVEETRNQVTVKRGPIVYCLESADLPRQQLSQVTIADNAGWQPVPMNIAGNRLVALKGKAKIRQQPSWKNQLYREVSKNTAAATLTLIPYYAWGNRGKTDMTVWMPLMRQ
ncbi:aceric acid hydrolase [Sediminibacterium soli]|uniref:aceric acid hydrolase n=1 Tax=Sediminibacterium soli TaxID=2698829 RepID=UPI00137A608C|nr:glycoside hydrolase family 127 protein [Sediminibacterium soli]NCI48191.1 glycoside hydrolase family 127 protein [Sediminibacterium soli]